MAAISRKPTSTRLHCRPSEVVLARFSRSRLYAWWYFAIALGFLLLAINRWVVGEKTWMIVLRLLIAAGFAILGYIQLNANPRTK